MVWCLLAVLSCVFLSAGKDSFGRRICYQCCRPYHVLTLDGRCVWSCPANTRPDLSNAFCGECLCATGYKDSGDKDDFGRKLCVPVSNNTACPKPLKHIVNGTCVLNCAPGTTPNDDNTACVCKKGYVPSGRTSDGRLICSRCCGPEHVIRSTASGVSICSWNCGDGAQPSFTATAGISQIDAYYCGKCGCKPGLIPAASRDAAGRLVCEEPKNVTCPSPYRRLKDGKCLWNCAPYTVPDYSTNRTCKCATGTVPAGKTDDGRRVCTPCRAPYHVIRTDATTGNVYCVWNCGPLSEPETDDSRAVETSLTAVGTVTSTDAAFSGKCICRIGTKSDGVDEFGRVRCKYINATCPAPDRRIVNGVCKTVCGVGAIPDASNNNLTCICPQGSFKYGVDSTGRIQCRECPGPYRVLVSDANTGARRCVWSCAAGTQPSIIGSSDNIEDATCVCQLGHVFSHLDEFKRRVCKPKNATCVAPKRVVNGTCQLVCGPGTEANDDGSACQCKKGYTPIGRVAGALVCELCPAPYRVVVTSATTGAQRCVWSCPSGTTPPFASDIGTATSSIDSSLPCVCKPGHKPAADLDDSGRRPCVPKDTCLAPYHVQDATGKCVYDCAPGTEPSDVNSTTADCVCKRLYFEVGRDAISRRVCELCPPPYHVLVGDRCVWSCAHGTTPEDPTDVTSKCICKPGFEAWKVDDFKRLVCRQKNETCLAPSHIMRNGKCVYNCGVGAMADPSQPDSTTAPCVCKVDHVVAGRDDLGRVTCRECPGPYHVKTSDGRCVWSCGAGTTPDLTAGLDGECVCKPGYTESDDKDKFGRRVCVIKPVSCLPPYHILTKDGRCVW